ncbi:hypothetical protein FOPG_00310 [Fusarium oxysporum f. sp. conglutinans race 2 54008]|uniref:Uncharacterized protein n=1 Tax=Fusarium oxysporum f. sp. conglutinans race 2 54008 TaxID=1089457 RepID=X0J044_FUSOX|nr:hypothetical protein FOPG_00310 [Fusarium oxysporum f. sp. conglutinans race 2 54008]EXL89721.1 hypothetical protein FOPG_00310 [Fusarium oxysporum f. sp. conglutinans race 2 54008]
MAYTGGSRQKSWILLNSIHTASLLEIPCDESRAWGSRATGGLFLIPTSTRPNRPSPAEERERRKTNVTLIFASRKFQDPETRSEYSRFNTRGLKIGRFLAPKFKVNKASQDQGQTSRPCSLETAILTNRQGELKTCGAFDFELKAWVKQTVLDLADRHGHFLMWEGEFHASVPQAQTILSILRTDRDFFPSSFFSFLPFPS